MFWCSSMVIRSIGQCGSRRWSFLIVLVLVVVLDARVGVVQRDSLRPNVNPNMPNLESEGEFNEALGRLLQRCASR
jgi:hypothetical protein